MEIFSVIRNIRYIGENRLVPKFPFDSRFTVPQVDNIVTRHRHHTWNRRKATVRQMTELTWKIFGSFLSRDPLTSSNDGGPCPVRWYRNNLNQTELI